MKSTSPMNHAGLDLSRFGVAWDSYGFASDPFMHPHFNPTPLDLYGTVLPASGSGLFSIGAYQSPH
jgi:hypothetical protein